MLRDAFYTAVFHLQKLTGQVPDKEYLQRQIEVFQSRKTAWEQNQNPNVPSNRHDVDVGKKMLNEFIKSEQDHIGRLQKQLHFFYPEDNNTNEIA